MTQAMHRALALYPPPATSGGTKHTSEPEKAAIAHATMLRTSLTSDDWPMMVRAFRLVMQRELPDSPRQLTAIEKQLHASLISEEAHEFASASGIVDQADGLLDIIYVAVGALLHMGFKPGQIHEMFAEVHVSNMTKVMDDLRPLINDGEIDPSQPIGKVLKTHNYVKADLDSIVAGFLSSNKE